MATPKLRIVYHEDEKNVLSYFHVERSEGLRIVEILKALPRLKDWTPASKLARHISARIAATLWTLHKLAGAKRIDIKLDNGDWKVVAKAPILYLRKDKHNSRANLPRMKHLKPTAYVKCPDRKRDSGTGGL